MDEPKRTEKHEAARNTLPDDLKPTFDDFVNGSIKYWAYALREGKPCRPPGETS